MPLFRGDTRHAPSRKAKDGPRSGAQGHPTPQGFTLKGSGQVPWKDVIEMQVLGAIPAWCKMSSCDPPPAEKPVLRPAVPPSWPRSPGPASFQLQQPPAQPQEDRTNKALPAFPSAVPNTIWAFFSPDSSFPHPPRVGPLHSHSSSGFPSKQ